MTSKKYLLLAGLTTLLATTELQAQDMSSSSSSMTRGGGYDLSDSSLIPKGRKGQAADFAAGQYDYPAKPRNQWEIGINGGLLNVSGDVRSKTPFNQPKNIMNTLGWGISVRKAWGYVVSTRLFYNRGVASGYNHESSDNYWGHGANPYLAAGYFSTSDRNVYYSYKSKIQELSLQMVLSLNNLKFHKARSKWGAYLFGGAGGMTYKTTMDLKDKSGALYNFSSINRPSGTAVNNIYKQRKNVNKQLLKMFDGDYETKAEEHPNRGKWNGATVRPIFNIGLGIQRRLSKRVTLQLEDKMTITMDDLIDGYRWQERPDVSTNTIVGSAMTRDFDNLNYMSLGLNVNLGGKSVDPLWWMNPMDFGYNALSRKSAAPDDKCSRDADADGISDCFDRCPNTPGGVSVDSHGCPFDTDGDGVADYKDKQLITPTECQPVDADGVGKCPDPECCKNRPVDPVGCGGINSGNVSFASGTAKLSSAAMGQLTGLASAMRANPNCKVVVIGCGNGSKVEQQRSWDRVNSVINYMVDKQSIDRERFIFQYGTSCDANSVEYRSAAQGEEGPSNLPPPHPNLRKN
jgi:OmpA-OmpF porin, OOP family